MTADGLEQARAAWVVTQFLAESLYQRLVLDLGESLEAASLSFGHWQQGQEGLKTYITKMATVEARVEPPRPEQWRGLAGWNWVTLVLESMIQRLLDSSSPGKSGLNDGEYA